MEFQIVSAAPSSHINQQWINPLIGDNSWTGSQLGIGTNINYSFEDTAEDVLINAARLALAEFANISKLTFTEVDDAHNIGITFGRSFLGDNILAQAVPIDNELGIRVGDIIQLDNINTSIQSAEAFEVGQVGYSTLLHEIGHALGLVHPDEDGASPFSSRYDVQFSNDDYSILSRFTPSVGPVTSQYSPPYTPQFADIAAIQYLYGANQEYNSGDSIYDFTEQFVGTIWDGGGVDLIDASAQNSAVTINLTEGDGSAASTLDESAFWIASGANIENATGSLLNDSITGNALANTLKGKAGHDTIDSGKGADTINGNAGNDRIDGGQGWDFLRGGQDRDSIVGDNGNDFINGNNHIDTISGGNGDDTIHGGKGNDELFGNAGDDVIFGDMGNDTLTGASGSDRFIFNAANSGLDVLISFVSGIDSIELRNSSFADSAEAFAAFASSTLDLSAGNSILFVDASGLSASDIIIV